MKPPLGWIRRARYASWVVAIAATGYLALRFDSVTLPAEGCSPLLAISPGTRLWIDVFADAPVEGDVVLFRDAGPGTLLLGRVVEPPLDLSSDAAREIASGALWIAGDHPSCPSRDSRLLGPIAREALAGRVVFTW